MPSPKSKQITAARLAMLPPPQWRGKLETLSLARRQAIAEEAAILVQRAALLAEYADLRGEAMPHAEAAARANKRLPKVRRAMGYTYPTYLPFVILP